MYYLLEPISSIKKKIKSAVTDSEAIVKYDKKLKPGISNLMMIYSTITGLSFKEIEKKYEGKGYGDFKGDLAEIVAEEIQKVQNRYNALVESNELDNILDEGYRQASLLAERKIKDVYKKMGFNRIKK